MPETPQVPVPYKFVEVEWLDAKSDNEWQKPEHVVKPVAARSRGWLVTDGLEHVTVCGSITADGDVSDCIAVPRGMVENLLDLGV